jgi:hypothetical protein
MKLYQILIARLKASFFDLEVSVVEGNNIKYCTADL